MFVFNKGYICSNCLQRFINKDTHVVYKNSCICRECYDKLAFTDKSFAFKGTRETEFVIAPFIYEDIYRNTFLKFKFNGEIAVGHLIGMMLEDLFGEINLIDGYDCIVPVPLSRQRLRERGYNQTEILAEYVGRAIGLPVCNYLKRIKHTKAQSGLIGLSRVENVRGAFNVTDDISGKKVLLFDDIVTTGSTVNECSRTLKSAGANRIGTICGAYVIRPEEKWLIY